jgi:hypothetical protein
MAPPPKVPDIVSGHFGGHSFGGDMSAYPELPSHPTGDDVPYSIKAWKGPHDNASWCPICGMRWYAHRNVDGKEYQNSNSGETYNVWQSLMDKMPYPHIRYGCGGAWRDLGDGYWGGRCWATKTQLVLEFAEEA